MPRSNAVEGTRKDWLEILPQSWGQVTSVFWGWVFGFWYFSDAGIGILRDGMGGSEGLVIGGWVHEVPGSFREFWKFGGCQYTAHLIWRMWLAGCMSCVLPWIC